MALKSRKISRWSYERINRHKEWLHKIIICTITPSAFLDNAQAWWLQDQQIQATPLSPRFFPPIYENTFLPRLLCAIYHYDDPDTANLFHGTKSQVAIKHLFDWSSYCALWQFSQMAGCVALIIYRSPRALLVILVIHPRTISQLCRDAFVTPDEPVML